MPDYNQLQEDCTEVVKDFLRKELGKDYYKGKLQAIVVLTNSVTGYTSLDSCNVPLTEDIKKMLDNAREMLLMDRIGSIVQYHVANAIVKALRKAGKGKKK
jgi:hypothetical protein